MKVLLIEDDRDLTRYLVQGLGEHGHVVDVTHTGPDGLHIASTGDHDLIVLDLVLPGVDGFYVLAVLRTAKKTPVLILTARAHIEDKVRAFELGADDYLLKPFEFPEFLARLKSLQRRGHVKPLPEVVRLRDIEIDVVKHRVVRAGRRIELSAKEFALLALLLRKAGQVLSRTQIASMVWDINFDSSTNVVEVAIRRLRSKVDDAFPTKLIRTVRGVGYVIDVEA